MSQSGILSAITSGGPVVETLTGNSGGPVGPNGSFNINLVGNNSSGINVVGNPGTNTLTVTAFQATTIQEGTVTLATNAQAIAGTDTANALTSSNLAAKLGTQTAHSLALFEGSNAALVPLGVATNGQLPIGSTGADPVLATLTAGTGISITNGAGSISIAINGGTVGETITGNSGGALSPTAGNWNILGTGSITTSGTGSTLTTQLTGLTNHALQIGAGTATLTQLGAGTTGQVLQTNTGADPTWSTATYPSTTTINDILYSSSNNVVGQITAGNNGVLISSTTGVPSWLADGTTGQILTATTGSPPSWASPATSGTVTSVSVVSANGFAGTVATATTTPAITLTTTATGVLSGNGTAISGSAITQHDVLVGGATNAITSVAPSATSGVPLISQGAASDPAFGTAVVAGGGTGNTTFTAYSLIAAGTTATGAFQNVSGVGTTGQILTSNGASALPTWQAAAASGIVTIDGDTGSITGSTVTIHANNASQNCGSSVSFVNSATTSTLNITDGNSNVLLGKSFRKCYSYR